MNAAEIIEALGDTAAVAADLGVSLSVVSNWKLRGMPRSRMLDVVELARRQGNAQITADIIRSAAASRPRQDAA